MGDVLVENSNKLKKFERMVGNFGSALPTSPIALLEKRHDKKCVGYVVSRHAFYQKLPI